MTLDPFLEATLGCFDRTAARAGMREVEGLVGGVHMRFRVAGEPLAASLLESLHLSPAPKGAEPAAVLSAFDSESGDEVPPPPPWSERDYLPRDAIRGFTAGRWRAAYSLTRLSLWLADLDRAQVAGWMRRPPPPESRDRAVPWWIPLSWLLPANGRPFVHAGAVGSVLVVGPGGTGKSTTTFAAAAAGLPCAGDDYVAVEEEEDGSWTAHALYRWARLDQASLARFPSARPVYRDDEKYGVEIPNAVESLRVRAVVLPIRAERTGRPRALPRAQLARALTPSTLMQVPSADGDLAGEIGRMLRTLPALGLEVGPDIERIPRAIEEASEMVAA